MSKPEREPPILLGLCEEPWQIAAHLRRYAKRLYNDMKAMNADEMRDMAHGLTVLADNTDELQEEITT